MKLIEQIGLKAIYAFDPETAHGMAIRALKLGLTPKMAPITSPRLRTHVAGLDMPNPVGLAAGFDKNAEVCDALGHSGFGFIEVGAATPRPQPGNPRPRLFRLTQDQASINRFGFNNQGMDVIANRLAARRGSGIVGLNLGANKDSADRAADFATVVKVTPSSKVVGDMAQYLVSNNLTVQDVLERGHTISFPQSVVQFFKGDLGQPVGGFPKDLQKLILKDEQPYTDRPNAHIPALDIDEEYKDFKKIFENDLSRPIDFTDFLSYKLYPKVFTEAYNKHLKYDSLINLPTKNFFYGMEVGEEIIVELDKGKTLLITLDSIGDANEEGMVTVYFKVNGQGRSVQIKDTSVKVETVQNIKADKENDRQIGAPLQGLLSTILVKKGDKVVKNQPLFVIEAMKMETTITANEDATISALILKEGTLVNAEDLVLQLEG